MKEKQSVCFHNRNLYYIMPRRPGISGGGGSYGQAKGTVGSGLTPGSRLGRPTSAEPNGSGSRTEKRFQKGKTVPSVLPHFQGQIRVKRHLNVQKKMSHAWNRTGTEPEPFGSSHVTPHFACLNTPLPEFDLENEAKLVEPFFGSGTVSRF